MSFEQSKIALQYLSGLKGIEIGGAAHNPFGLDTINVDICESEIFKSEQIRLCGEAMPVDVVSPGDDLPFADNSFDFVISSHVIEHFYDPIKAINEWCRVATKYIFMIVPHKQRTFDKDSPLTTVKELILRHQNPISNPQDKHWSIWQPSNFIELLNYMGLTIELINETDDKVGNGFTVIIKI